MPSTGQGDRCVKVECTLSGVITVTVQHNYKYTVFSHYNSDNNFILSGESLSY